MCLDFRTEGEADLGIIGIFRENSFIAYGHFMWKWDTLLCLMGGNKIRLNAKEGEELWKKLKIPCHLFVMGE